MWYRRNMADEKLRKLQREASLGDPEAIERLARYLERTGHPRVLLPPVEPYEWANKVRAWEKGVGGASSGSWLLTFGAYGDLLIVVREASAEEAIEIAAGWLASNAPGHFVDPEYDLDEDGNCSECGQDPHNMCEHIQDAEADLTYTESGWLTWEWSIDEIDEDQAIASELSRALPDMRALPEEDEFAPLIVFGSFWHAISVYPQQHMFFPSDWNETEVRDTLDKDRHWSLNAPEEGVYACWVEAGDDPAGDDAEIYSQSWVKAGWSWSRYKNDADRWVAGAKALLSEVTNYRESE